MRITALVLLSICMYREGTHIATIVAVSLLLIHAEITTRRLQDIKQNTDTVNSRVNVYRHDMREIADIVKRMLSREAKGADSGGTEKPQKTEGEITA